MFCRPLLLSVLLWSLYCLSSMCDFWLPIWYLNFFYSEFPVLKFLHQTLHFLEKRELRIAHPIHDDNMLEVHLRTEILHVSQFMMTAIQCIRLYYEREFFTDPNITTTDNATYCHRELGGLCAIPFSLI
jgi:hypothetical protein